jgi:hypothetical protein
MLEMTTNQVKTQVDVERSKLQFQLPYPDSTAGIISIQALDFCAQKMGLAGHQAVAERLQKGEHNTCQYYRYSIAQQAAEYLGAQDKEVKAVYTVDYDATSNDLCFGKDTPMSLIHLIIWVERKTNALVSLVEALDRALVQRHADIIGLHQLAHLLDVQIVNDEEVENRVGYGAMLSSLYNRPIKIWGR